MNMRILMNYFLIKRGIYGGEKDEKLLKNNGEMDVKTNKWTNSHNHYEKFTLIVNRCMNWLKSSKLDVITTFCHTSQINLSDFIIYETFSPHVWYERIFYQRKTFVGNQCEKLHL